MHSMRDTLQQYVPSAEIAEKITQWVLDTQCQLRITPTRRSKLGDYRHPFGTKGHRISVNGDLNLYAFLITCVHEFAHLKTWQTHRNRVKPHGKEWKHHFQVLMQPFFEMQVFPDDVYRAIEQYMANPTASSCTDLHLYKILRRYDLQRTSILVEQLPLGAAFHLSNGRSFVKGEKLRKRYRCTEKSTGRVYLFSAIAEVYLL